MHSRLHRVIRLLRALACVLPVVLAGQLRADECERLPKPSVTVKRLDERVTLNSEYGYKALTHLGSALAPPGNQVLGLTRGNAVVQVVTNTPSYVERSGRWECASPQLAVTLAFSPLTVYVAKEFPAGSCAYNEIYQHELRHVRTYQAHLASVEKEVLDTLSRRFATGRPWRAPVGQTRALLQRELDERWLPYIKREIARGEEAQARIDTREEYARVANSCNGEIKRLTR